MKRHAQGFTLIEVLLATVLLATGLALALASIRSISAMTTRGEVMSQRNERMRAVEGLLRRRLASARAIAFATEADTLRPYLFVGEPQRMRFVSDLPNYLGRGGPYLHDVYANADYGMLMLDMTLVQGGQPMPERSPRPPERLAEGLDSVRFRYRGLAENGGLGPWQERWDQVDALPVQVAILVQPRQEAPWPELVVTLAEGNGGGAAASAPSGLRR
nr:prepilin-type N-terminal cleavage/methylation domain-containing protein [Pseudoxanthomonas composti]